MPLSRRGLVTCVQVYTDHKNLECLHRAKALNQQQLWWTLFFLYFDFVIFYHPGIKNSKANALWQKGKYYLDQKDSNPKTSCMLKSHNFLGMDSHQDLLTLIRSALAYRIPPDEQEGICKEPHDV